MSCHDAIKPKQRKLQLLRSVSSLKGSDGCGSGTAALLMGAAGRPRELTSG